MATNAQIIAEIIAAIGPNGRQAITGAILQQVLVDIVSLPNVADLTTAQIKQGLGDPTSLGYDPNFLVSSNIPPGTPYNAVNIAWEAPFAPSGGALYTFIATQLGLSASVMATFYAACAAYPVAP